MNSFQVNKVAILGAGVMGVQIAAHFVNVGISVTLFDLASKDDSTNFIVKETITALLHLNPKPLVSHDLIKYITPANYSNDLDKLIDCDLIIESITENYAWKSDLYKKIIPYINKSAVLTTNTSGLSINKLSLSLPEDLQSRFLGMHFFNPPRFMKLVELVASKQTNPKIIDNLEEFLVSNLGKGVLRAKDTPNFLANRIGIAFTFIVMHYADKFNLPPDLVDTLTGKIIGRPNTATFKLLDLVGLDTFSRIASNMQKELKDDPWSKFFEVPEWIQDLANVGNFGVKTGSGIYKKSLGRLLVIDLENGGYRSAIDKLPPEIGEILSLKNPYSWFEKLKFSTSTEAQFLWNCCRDFLHYIVYHKEKITFNIADIDLALKWGYGWQAGPFEIWRMAGWHEVLKLINDDIVSNKSLISSDIAPIPEWVFSFDGILEHKNIPLHVYQKQWFTKNIIGEPDKKEAVEIFSDRFVRFWTLDNTTVILSFKTSHNHLTAALIDSISSNLDKITRDYRGLIIWQDKDLDFCPNINPNKFTLDLIGIEKLQRLCFKLRSLPIPVVSAACGNALGAGLELMLYSDKNVVALESYLGFNKISNSIKLPFGGGLTEIIRRTSTLARLYETSIYSFLKSYCRTITQNRISGSAKDNIAKLFLSEDDLIVANRQEILFLAHKQIYSILENNYHAPLDTYASVEVGGSKCFMELEQMLEEMLETEQIFDSAFATGLNLAKILSGGKVVQGTEVNINSLLRLEQEVALDIYSSANNNIVFRDNYSETISS